MVLISRRDVGRCALQPDKPNQVEILLSVFTDIRSGEGKINTEAEDFMRIHSERHRLLYMQ